MRYRLVERAVMKGRTGTGIGTGSGGRTKVAIAATQNAGVAGLRDRVCVLHGRLWPRGHRHGDRSGSGERLKVKERGCVEMIGEKWRESRRVSKFTKKGKRKKKERKRKRKKIKSIGRQDKE
jgi:hypothetical protein